jgi:putative ABC transport system permease protein
VQAIFRQAISIAFKRYRRDWLFSLCSVFSMAAFLVPLLTVFGLKDGIVGTMRNRLSTDPGTLEITPVGHPNFTPEFFRDLEKDPDVTFVVPNTRDVSNVIMLVSPDRDPLRVSTGATAHGDPLLALVPAGDSLEGAADDDPELRQIWISSKAAKHLGLRPGNTVIGRVSRTSSGFVENAEAEFTVLGVLPPHAADTELILGSLGLIRAVELYRSGYAHDGLGWPGNDPSQMTGREGGVVYQQFRLYAKDLDAVTRIQARLNADDIMVKAHTAEIARVRNMDTAFSMVTLTLLAVVLVGALASAASGSIDQVAKNRKSLACLALLGMGKAHLQAFSSFQAALSGFLASALATGLFLVTARILNYLFMGSIHNVERFCTLSWEKLGAASGAVVLFMVLASLTAYKALSDIEPSEGMRDV